jgi:chorismate lyase/3-hydroxybenzoate synthase
MPAAEPAESVDPYPSADPGPPSWVRERFGASAPSPEGAAEVLRAPGAQLVRVAAPGVGRLDAPSFQRTVAEAYRALFRPLSGAAASHPVRLWAFVPDIHARMGPGLDRYMVFNGGRFEAFSDWYGGKDAFPRAIATASAVGVRGDALVLYAWALERPGHPVENPRQVPAYRYSRRFGPLPPCFSRAMVVDDPVLERRRVLIGGTASIRGEESMHLGDVGAQIEETFANLATLIVTATGTAGAPPCAEEAALGRLRALRVYHPRPQDAPAIRAALVGRCPGLTSLEVLGAELCRPELLVEIEGVAAVDEGA